MNASPKTSRHIEAPQNCTGCGLCASTCPKNAISMVWSEDGFPVPKVEESLCIECGLCTKACIALEEPPAHEDDISKVRSYAAWNRSSELHHNSSSGGVFTALARQILSMGGCVFGVVWQDKETATFAKAETPDELEAMRGSKYTPALPGLVYREVKEELATGRAVLFTGTPCQVHALKSYLRHKDYDNLYTQEIVCHGAPSHNILRKYIREDEAASGKAIERISFREKLESWQCFSVTRYYTDGTSASRNLRTDPYMTMFLCNGALNYSCYNCPYAHLPREADLCLGDYWGVQNIHPEWPVRWGISAIISNTEKGHKLLMKASDSLILKDEPFKNIYGGQSIIYVKPVTPVHPQRPYALDSLRAEDKPLRDAIEQAKEHDFLFGRRVCRKNPLIHLILNIRKRLRKRKLIK